MNRVCIVFMSEDVDPIRKLFEDFGGTTAMARAMGVKQSAASEMKRRKSIPVRYWANLIGLESTDSKRVITLQDLHDLHRQKADTEAA